MINEDERRCLKDAGINYADRVPDEHAIEDYVRSELDRVFGEYSGWTKPRRPQGDDQPPVNLTIG